MEKQFFFFTISSLFIDENVTYWRPNDRSILPFLHFYFSCSSESLYQGLHVFHITLHRDHMSWALYWNGRKTLFGTHVVYLFRWTCRKFTSISIIIYAKMFLVRNIIFFFKLLFINFCENKQGLDIIITMVKFRTNFQHDTFYHRLPYFPIPVGNGIILYCFASICIWVMSYDKLSIRDKINMHYLCDLWNT